MSRRNLDGSPQSAEFIVARSALCDERLLLLHEGAGPALREEHVIVVDLDPIAGQRHDPLDEVRLRLARSRLLARTAVRRLARDPARLVIRALRRLEDNDVAAARVPEMRTYPVH